MGLVEAVLEDMDEWRADMMRWRGWVQEPISDLNQEVNDMRATGPRRVRRRGRLEAHRHNRRSLLLRPAGTT